MGLKMLLDEAKAITGSDRQTAIALGIDAAFMSHIRAGRKAMPTAKAFRLADILKRPHLHVVCEVEAEQVKDPKDRDMYLRLKSGFMASAGVLLLASQMYVASALIDTETGAMLSNTPYSNVVNTSEQTLYLLRTKLCYRLIVG